MSVIALFIDLLLLSTLGSSESRDAIKNGPTSMRDEGGCQRAAAGGRPRVASAVKHGRAVLLVGHGSC